MPSRLDRCPLNAGQLSFYGTRGGYVSSTLLTTTLVRADQSRSFQVLAAPSNGWQATEHQDQRIVQQQHYADWHRVERALAHFAREIDALREQGWREA